MTIASQPTEHWNVFLSSCFRDEDDEDLAIRKRIEERFNLGDDKPIWMGEDFEIIGQASTLPPIEKALFCVKGVRHCDAYVAIVIDKHGTGIPLGPGKPTQVSFLELELFEAAVSRKPAFVFVLKGHEPTGKMKALLDLLGPALPGLIREPLDEDEIMRRLERILLSTRHPWLSRLSRFVASSPVAHDQLGLARHRTYRAARDLPAVQFLNGPYDATLEPPSFEVVERALNNADTYQDHQSRLALLWIAIRELMGERPETVGRDDLLHWWDVAYGKWASSAAWYGLHGFCLMGCLGAISTRSRMLRSYSAPPPAPHGAFASEYYSIGKKSGNPALRQTFFDLALDHIDVSLAESRTDGSLAIRGSIYWNLGRTAEAVSDYEEVVTLREARAAPPRTIGEGKAELGFALLAEPKTRVKGLRFLEEGVAMFDGKPDGFLVRATRKLAYGYLKCGSPRRAMNELVAAYDLAVANSMFDQIGPTERAAKRLEWALSPFSRLRH